ncbi:polyketide synthase [Staphylotrichum tortipilum]|uniref:Polyketide synthase n=1 Tax=Staphylotrichum tortipilum TaxID=2831512 RepID=A0AAN6RTL7_9PEZI|nr:polyketide synthase [Staphylotrichum longicolle]
MSDLEPIAIVGMSCRLPGDVSTPGEFYRMLCRRRSGWSEIPPDRFNAQAYHHPNPDKKGCFNSGGGYFIKDDISMFDAGFFDITKKEAESMDPAQRLLFECAYEALENAGVPKESISGSKVGVFIGGNYSEHRAANMRDLDHIPTFDATGNQGAFLAGRISYFLNVTGPAFTVDTACSSSMHALHLAVQSIRMGESDQAIVGASHLITDPDIWVSMGKLRLFSDAGKTYAFDERAKSGYARGEGAGCLVLKPLSQAQADNDHIFSVITHSGISHNGRTVGIVAPSEDQQTYLLNKVFREANIDPVDVGFFEAHGTGTKKGDPIEARAIYRAVGSHFGRQAPLYIGSAKPNVGHLECASGVVSVIKAVLMLYYGFVLPNADFETVNPDIPLATWNMRVATGQQPWPAKRKYVCVNNFGFSGSNSTCVLQAAPQIRGLEVADSVAYRPLRLFVLSANDEAALRNSVKRLGIWIEQHAELYQTTMPRNLAYTLCQRRSHLPWRVAVVAGMCGDVATALNSHEATPARASTEKPRVAFVYTGQGAQWHAMGRELLQTHPVFYNAIVRADKALKDIGADFSILEELKRDKESTRVGLAHISQPICTAVQLALTDLFESFGIQPSAVTGHSSGEIGAAYAAGALTFESAMAAGYYRGQVIVELKKNHPELKGSMMAVGAGAEELEPMLEELFGSGSGPTAVVACENSPSSTTLSGDEEAIDRVGEMFQEKGVFNRKLFVDVAYHSPHMQLIAESYLARVSHIKAPTEVEESKVAFFSALYGHQITLDKLGPEYWVKNLTQAVRFSNSMLMVCTRHCPDILLEIGPHAALKGPIMQALKRIGSRASKIAYLPTLVRGQDATHSCLNTAGQLWVRGCHLDFFEVNHHREEDEKPELVPSLYTYPWSRQKYWYESRLTRQHRLKPFARNDLLGTLADWSNDLEPTWRNIVRTEDLPWLKDYQAKSCMLFPVAGFLTMVIEAAKQSPCLDWIEGEKLEMKNIIIPEQLFLTEGKEYEVLLSLRPLRTERDRCHEFRICSYESSRGWLEHCAGRVAAAADTKQSRPKNVNNDAVVFISRTREEGYDRLQSGGGLVFPAGFKTVGCAMLEKGGLVEAQCETQDTVAQMPLEHETAYEHHPAVIDAMFHVPLLASGNRFLHGPESAPLPCSIRQMTVRSGRWAGGKGERFDVSSTGQPGIEGFMVELHLQQTTAISIAGLEYSATDSAPSQAAVPRELCFKFDWEPLKEPEAGDGDASEEEAGMRAKACERGVTLVTACENGHRDPRVGPLRSSIEKHLGVSPVVCGLQAIKNFDSYFIVLSELEEPVLSALSKTSHHTVKKMLVEAGGVLWVTRGATRFPVEPTRNMALGLIRAVRSEREAVAATLDLDFTSQLWADEQAQLIWQTFELAVMSENETAEMEFAEEGGKLVVPRIVPDEEANLDVHRSLGPSAPYNQPFHQPGRQLRLAARADASALDQIYFRDAPDVDLADDEVEILVAASALSQDDIASRVGDQSSAPIARSCSGTVTRIGGKVTGIREGSRVCALAEGPFGTHARARHTSVAVISDSMSAATAACIPGPYLAAYYALANKAKVQGGERVLIQLSGPAGLAAIAVAQHLGAAAYVLVKNEDETRVAEKAGISPSRMLDTRSIYLRQELDKATNGEGMEVVLALSGQGPARAWECLASFGRFVEIRTPGNHNRTRAELGVNSTFSSINMVNVAASHPLDMQKALKAVVHNVELGLIACPRPGNVVPVSELTDGLQVVHDGAVESVVAVAHSEAEQVKALHKVSKSIFREDGTHVIVGGTGGLGMSMARYMIKHGARTIVLLSRSGGGQDAVNQLQQQMAHCGARVLVKQCDVCNVSQLWEVVEECRKTLPKVCGVIHAAMVLRDSLVERMSFDDYQAVIQPKVMGAWNLQKVLMAAKLEVDYFVALSSASGVLGSRGQGAYAAANTFLDAFVQFRKSRGQPAVALDLSAVTGVGYLAENEERQQEIIRNFGGETVNEGEVLALLSAAVRGVCGPQCLTGLKLHLGSEGQWPYYASDARFAHLKAECLAVAEREGLMPKQTVSPGIAFRAATSEAEATEIVAQGIVQKLSEVLTVSPDDLDVARNITSYGLDSLTAIELRNWIAKEFRANLQILELLSSGTIADLAGLIVQKTKA